MAELSEVCRQKAQELCGRAKQQSDFRLRVEYENLAFLYMKLADHASSHERLADTPAAACGAFLF